MINRLVLQKRQVMQPAFLAQFQRNFSRLYIY